VRAHLLDLVSTALWGSLFDLASVVWTQRDTSGSSTGGVAHSLLLRDSSEELEVLA
jgi:hypothetical protein